ncbi:MAG TPA: phosphate signaling complex protein PhoU [Steroidobacteraceae bacterium]|nr:phosphate signaling complex protein PhoU [Steroidobacteraceae bacterium]
MREGHISKAFDGELAGLHIRVLEMGGLVLDQVREAAHAYGDWDAHAAQRVAEREGTVGGYAAAVYDLQLALIARRNPVASDLRAIVGLGRAAYELDRAGADARRIARTVLAPGGRPGRSTASDARHLADLALTLLRSCLEALDVLDGEAAAQIIERDHDLDAEYAAGLRRLLSRAMENPANLDVTVEAAFALKSLERIGDHACNVARQVAFMATGPGAACAAPAGRERGESGERKPGEAGAGK